MKDGGTFGDDANIAAGFESIVKLGGVSILENVYGESQAHE
jgi:hypothetical protein